MRRGVGVSPGNVSVFYGDGKLRSVERKLKVAELVLRLVTFVFGVVAAALVSSDSQVRVVFSIEKKAKFTDMKALVFLVMANGIAAGYGLMQGMRCVLSMAKGSALFSKGLAWAIFSCDQVMAYVTMAAFAAGAQSAVLGKFGQTELQWMKICDLYGKFCTQVGEGVASAFVVSLSMVAISSISTFNVFRLYGSNEGKNATGW